MSYGALRRAAKEISEDLGKRSGEGVLNVANNMVRSAIARRLGTQHYLISDHYWIIADQEDLATAASDLMAYFSAETNERVQARETWKDQHVSLRPSAIWMEGKKHRVQLITCSSFDDPIKGMQWKAELTEYAKLALYGYRYPDTRKKLEMVNASEHAAQKSMRDLFESHFDLRLDSI